MKTCPTLLLAALLSVAAAASPARAQLVQVDASAPIPAPETGFLHLGGTSPTGRTLQVNSRYLVLDGKPWLPVMGEIHYTRLPEREWEDEILKMKAAGIDIISTYIFWIHHEEVEGQFDWSGRRNLRHFVELCGKHGMYVYLRPGPWAHGEVRNGGFPDWLVHQPNVRTNDPAYLAHVTSFFTQIGQQIQGLTWKDGGPIVGAQLENEYPMQGPGRGAEHILRLKQIAIAAGIDPPLFSVTGWPTLDFPPHEVIPVSGGYPDGFWFGAQTELPASMNYLFNLNRELGDMGATVPANDPTGKVDLKHDPYFAAEEAGGMNSAYHRRPVIQADDVAALTLTGIGAGLNLYGYYMFHGGANPQGKLSTLQESQATGYPNDLPEINYDFEAPLGEYGQVRESYRKTRVLHLFLNSFGAQLAPMAAVAPAIRPKNAADTSTTRLTVRSDGSSGFLFVNNYVRQLPMPERKQFQASIQLRTGVLRVPEHPVDIPANSYFFWPFNLQLGKASLLYSTAQVLTRLHTEHGEVIALFAVPGIAPEFHFETSTVKHMAAAGGTVSTHGSVLSVDRIAPGLAGSIEVTDLDGEKTTLLVLTKEQAEQCALLHLRGQDYLALSPSNLFLDGDHIHLRSTASPTQQIAFLPALQVAEKGSAPVRQGLWTTYRFSRPAAKVELTSQLVQAGTPRAAMDLGPPVDWRKAPVPTVPEAGTWTHAGVWNLSVPSTPQHGLSNVFLQIVYTGDIGRLRIADKLVDDNFFNGQPWTIGLKRLASNGESPDSKSPGSKLPLQLDLLPMPASAPIYLDRRARHLLEQNGPAAKLVTATLLPEYETVLSPAP